jgi:hypothetical protein
MARTRRIASLRSGWMVETLWVTVAMGEPQERFGPDGEIGL